MTANQIENVQKQANLPYEVAKQIRAILDQARKDYGAADWDGDDVEAKIVELVTEE